MPHPASPRPALADRLALGAILLSAVSALVGLVIPGIYRDQPILVQAMRADHLFQLVVAGPALIAWRFRATPTGRVVLAAVVLYLAYFFGLYALSAVISWATLPQVTVFGLAAWALVIGLPTTDAGPLAEVLGPRLLRRTTLAFLVLVAAFHIPLWAGQILGSAASGRLPAAIQEFGWLTTPVYTFDLALALPLGLVAAGLLGAGDARGVMLALAFGWFSLLLALDMVVEQIWFGITAGAVDVAQVLPFGMIVLLSALVVVPPVVRRPPTGAAALSGA